MTCVIDDLFHRADGLACPKARSKIGSSFPAESYQASRFGQCEHHDAQVVGLPGGRSEYETERTSASVSCYGRVMHELQLLRGNLLML